MNVEELIQSANPVRTGEVPPGDSPHARRLLAGLPARRVRPSRRGRRAAGLALGGVAAAGLAAAVVAVTLPASPARPAGPGRPAAAPAGPGGALRGLVLAAARQPAVPTVAPGQFQYTESESLSEADTLNDHGHTFAVDYVQHRQIWIGADGSGRLAEAMTDPTFPTAGDHAQWVADGSPSLAEQPTDQTFGRHGLSDGPGKKLATLPTDPARLARLISSRAIEGGPAGPGEDFVQVGDLLRETDAPPALRAALFQVASHIPGVTVVAGTHDHSGRAGVALEFLTKVTSGPMKGRLDQQELIFDPATSALIGEQYAFVDPATQAASNLNWTDYLKSFIVTSTTSITPVGSGQ